MSRATPSTAVRSNAPEKNAPPGNSPRRGHPRAPRRRQPSKQIASAPEARPPCELHHGPGACSSPGPKTITPGGNIACLPSNARPMRRCRPALDQLFHRCRRPNTRAASCTAAGPLRPTMPRVPTPGGEEMATIVSSRRSNMEDPTCGAKRLTLLSKRRILPGTNASSRFSSCLSHPPR